MTNKQEGVVYIPGEGENHNFYTYGQYLQVEERKTVFRSGVLECVHYSIYNWVEKSGFQVEKYKRNM